MWKITISQETDSKLLQLFPTDPDADITIVTANGELHLVLAYLSLDSTFFADLTPTTAYLDLSDLPAAVLEGVLRCMYGGELVVRGVRQLSQLWVVTGALGIQEYRQKAGKGLLQLHEEGVGVSPLWSIEMLEFSLRQGFLKEQVCQLHFKNNLQVLQDTRNYLQLAKLSHIHLNEVLLGYLQLTGISAGKTVNAILENYFNRKALRAVDYFQDQTLAPLRQIWEDYHHRIYHKNPKIPLTKTFPASDTRLSAIFLRKKASQDHSPKLRLLHTTNLPTHTFDSLLCLQTAKSESQSEEDTLSLRIQQLEKDKQERDIKIAQLQKQLQKLSELLVVRQAEQQNQLQDITLLQNVVRSRKSKEDRLRKEISLNQTSENAFEIARPLLMDSWKGGFRTPTFLSKRHLA